MTSNGCNEDGWDLYEEHTRKEFEAYAVRQGYNLERDGEYSWIYSNNRTEEAWKIYHIGHVSGRGWKE